MSRGLCYDDGHVLVVVLLLWHRFNACSCSHTVLKDHAACHEHVQSACHGHDLHLSSAELSENGHYIHTRLLDTYSCTYAVAMFT